MGWFWADQSPTVKGLASPPPVTLSGSLQSQAGDASPPAGCPMHKRTISALNPSSSSFAPSSPVSAASQTQSSCPVPHGKNQQPESTLSKLNPLNYMFRDLSQAPAPQQKVSLPTSRDASTIPRGDAQGNWEYPSPQQMYNALLRKGYTDTDATAVESMVAVHNFLNEGAWGEIVDWERRFGGGLARGWQASRRGEANVDMQLRRLEARERMLAAGSGSGTAQLPPPTLVRFQGRPGDMTPKAAMLQALGWVYPSRFGTEPPFDRHDWYVSRETGERQKLVRYVIDYYAGPPEPTGEPVFYLDVRPAMTPTGAAERFIRWGSDVWWRASGGEVREIDAAKV